ncbi:MAG: hypothetical protein H7335_16575 [Massilia sp.]|nr:hypothetical protein [Massilia sp.]
MRLPGKRKEMRPRQSIAGALLRAQLGSQALPKTFLLLSQLAVIVKRFKFAIAQSEIVL